MGTKYCDVILACWNSKQPAGAVEGASGKVFFSLNSSQGDPQVGDPHIPHKTFVKSKDDAHIHKT